jgi:hypothetical protein
VLQREEELQNLELTSLMTPANQAVMSIFSSTFDGLNILAKTSKALALLPSQNKTSIDQPRSFTLNLGSLKFLIPI